MTDKLEIEQIKLDPYSYIKGTHLGLLIAQELVSNPIDKQKIMAASIEVHRKSLHMKKEQKNG